MARTVRWAHRLSFRFGILLGPIVLVSVAAFTLVAIRRQEDQIVAEAARGATLLSETILRSIDHQMHSDNRKGAYTTMEVIARHPRLRALRLINAASEVTWSTDPGELGSPLNREQLLCASCHRGDLPLEPCTQSSWSIVADPQLERRVVAVMTPVVNEARCSNAGCHPPPGEQRILGVIGLEVEMDEMAESLSALQQRMVGLSFATFLALTVPVVLFFRSVVARPIGDLLEGTHRVAQGDLDLAVPEHDRSELGHLKKAFNAMTLSLRQARTHVDELMAGLEQQVKERTDKLTAIQEELAHAEKLSSLGRLSASIAHEINNPLMGILTSAKLLLRALPEAQLSPRDEKLYRRQLELVQRESERCRTIVRNLLDFARQRSLEVKTIDVNAALEEALSIVANQLRLQGVAVNKTAAPRAQARADFGQVRQAILNILVNACDVMPEGGALTCRTFMDERGRRVCVEVADTGPGIPEEVRSHIFDPFFTTHDKGTGLGLSVVYGIVNRHGGTVEVESEPGQGTRFRLWFPVSGPRETP